MIEYHYEIDFRLENESLYSDWVNRVIKSEGLFLEELNYIFCDDKYLLRLNRKYLDHDTLTDIISFDYSADGLVKGDIFISYERVVDNARLHQTAVPEELKRVMIHGVLHLAGYNDKTKEEQKMMRTKEDEMIRMFHVEH